MRISLQILLLITLMIVSMCCASYPLGFIGGIERLDPPEIYHTWYLEAATCAGVDTLDYPYEALTFYVSHGLYNRHSGRELWGFYRDGAIYIAREAMLNGYVIRHEVLHYFGYHHGDQILTDCEYYHAPEEGKEQSNSLLQHT